ncbi:hypothetical protein GLOTRDRAFT_94125 [Gloeophyllum trabeum ATCC 11539]|uniref:Uncharacterized protein n=1 Tax=Gloeophyllum trabeum (strain ATCC 11539 / FP-39264 / Madison 617) TaxID=670483 RepID=S7RJY4_GLOTA|nr:uncharacterized protein GLOTRDRAFT_94125 [Gloeophyllum trabeum ATCC 11539]EPQ54690.1 hypothetical protein GLOTRDRAFT_94125 [Gloeophyllum trabeum ATCC 11539]
MDRVVAGASGFVCVVDALELELVAELKMSDDCVINDGRGAWEYVAVALEDEDSDRLTLMVVVTEYDAVVEFVGKLIVTVPLEETAGREHYLPDRGEVVVWESDTLVITLVKEDDVMVPLIVVAFSEPDKVELPEVMVESVAEEVTDPELVSETLMVVVTVEQPQVIPRAVSQEVDVTTLPVEELSVVAEEGALVSVPLLVTESEVESENDTESELLVAEAVEVIVEQPHVIPRATSHAVVVTVLWTDGLSLDADDGALVSVALLVAEPLAGSEDAASDGALLVEVGDAIVEQPRVIPSSSLQDVTGSAEVLEELSEAELVSLGALVVRVGLLESDEGAEVGLLESDEADEGLLTLLVSEGKEAGAEESVEVGDGDTVLQMRPKKPQLVTGAELVGEEVMLVDVSVGACVVEADDAEALDVVESLDEAGAEEDADEPLLPADEELVPLEDELVEVNVADEADEDPDDAESAEDEDAEDETVGVAREGGRPSCPTAARGKY